MDYRDIGISGHARKKREKEEKAGNYMSLVLRTNEVIMELWSGNEAGITWSGMRVG